MSADTKSASESGSAKSTFNKFAKKAALKYLEHGIIIGLACVTGLDLVLGSIYPIFNATGQHAFELTPPAEEFLGL